VQEFGVMLREQPRRDSMPSLLSADRGRVF
jgi:hypothetical protein